MDCRPPPPLWDPIARLGPPPAHSVLPFSARLLDPFPLAAALSNIASPLGEENRSFSPSPQGFLLGLLPYTILFRRLCYTIIMGGGGGGGGGKGGRSIGTREESHLGKGGMGGRKVETF